MAIRLSARTAAVACLGVATAMALLALREGPRSATPTTRPVAASALDPLRTRLANCQREGQAAASDATCLTAWAENRRRFLGVRRDPDAWQAEAGYSPAAASTPEEK